MQAIKYITMPASGTIGNRPTSNLGSEEGSVRLGETNTLCTEIADFLTKCGVENCAYEQRDGDAYPWLYIFGKRCLIWKNNSNIWNFTVPIRGSSLVSNFQASNFGTNVAAAVVFTGNPKNGFVLRLLHNPINETSGTSPGFYISRFSSKLSGVEGVVYGSISTSSSMSNQVEFVLDENNYAVLSHSYGFSASSFLLTDLDGATPLVDRGYLWMDYSSVYLWPSGIILSGNGSNELFQREVSIAGHRYMVLDKLGVGMIRLDDDDPPVTEEDFLGGVQ